MKKLLAAALFFAVTAAQAQVYVGAMLGRASAPAPQIPHGEIEVKTESNGNSEAFLLGYRFKNKLFTEIVGYRLPDANSNTISWSGGTGITSVYEANSTQTTNSMALLVGVPIVNYGSAEFSALVGLHNYHQTTKFFSRFEQVDEATGAEIQDTVARRTVDDRKTAPLIGLGLSVPVNQHLAVIGRITRFGQIDQTVLEFGATVRF